jgi:hypothetical protein
VKTSAWEHDPVATQVLRDVLREARKPDHGCHVEHLDGSDPTEWRVTVAGETVPMVMQRDLDYDGMIRSMAAAFRHALGLRTGHGFKRRKRKAARK